MKNLIITLTLLLGVMSYGQSRLARTFVHQYDRGGEKIYTLKLSAQQDCTGHEDRYRIELYDRLQGNTNVLVIGDALYQITAENRSEFISGIERNRDDYRNIADEQAPRPTPTDYWDSDFNVVDPFCNQHSTSKYLRSKSNYDSGRSTSSRFHYGPRGDAYIDTSSGFTVRFGATEWTETQRHRAYDRLRQVYALQDWEQNLIAREFEPYTGPLTYLYERSCSSGGPIRINRYLGNRVVVFHDGVNRIEDYTTAIETVDFIISRNCN